MRLSTFGCGAVDENERQAVVRNVLVEPVRQAVALGLDVLEDGVDVSGDTDPKAHVAVGAHPLD
ncbi:hypothetical protein ACFV9E_38435 [Streptomyces sp. NPDC059835]|uniref:hypothetical protein n=1 Tax=Streptomyces sp. NPDC059835 TaxID=3346967 RepID=UPI00365123FB